MGHSFKERSKDKNKDPNASQRKEDHIKLAFESKVEAHFTDQRFYFEPLMASHPDEHSIPVTQWAGYNMNLPIWVSSMTGGTEWAGIINRNLAKACGEFGMGMGLGSCRSLLYSDKHLSDFQLRKYMGDQPLFANLGIAQIEELLRNRNLQKLEELLEKLEVDGLIIHVNPLQEWLQPEGDRIEEPPIETIKRVLDKVSHKLIIKEVGQGMGRESLTQLLQLPLTAVDFAAHGGTNFAKLEILRNQGIKDELFLPLSKLGHTVMEMLDISNNLVEELGSKRQCDHLIISGGIGHYLDGYYLIHNSSLPAIYGQASGFLKYARSDYAELKEYVEIQKEGLSLAYSYLRVK